MLRVKKGSLLLNRKIERKIFNNEYFLVNIFFYIYYFLYHKFYRISSKNVSLYTYCIWRFIQKINLELKVFLHYHEGRGPYYDVEFTTGHRWCSYAIPRIGLFECKKKKKR